MKRNLTILLAACAVVAFARWSDSAQGQEDLFADAIPPAAVVAADKATPTTAEADLQKMREELVALTKTRAEMMNRDELADAIAAAKVQNSRVHAKRELERAKALLLEITEKHPGTPAGQSAAKALQYLGVETMIPEPDAKFSPPDPFGQTPGYVPPAGKKAQPFGELRSASEPAGSGGDDPFDDVEFDKVNKEP